MQQHVNSVTIQSMTMLTPWYCQCGAVVGPNTPHGKEEGCQNPQATSLIKFGGSFEGHDVIEFVETIGDLLAVHASARIMDREFVRRVATEFANAKRQ